MRVLAALLLAVPAQSPLANCEAVDLSGAYHAYLGSARFSEYRGAPQYVVIITKLGDDYQTAWWTSCEETPRYRGRLTAMPRGRWHEEYEGGSSHWTWQVVDYGLPSLMDGRGNGWVLLRP